MYRKILLIVVILYLSLGFNGVSGTELTVAEKEQLRMAVQIKKNFEEQLKAPPTTVTGQALLPDGLPAIGFKIGGWGRSLANLGYGHFLFDTVTDTEGRFSLALYRSCEYWITIDDPDNKRVAPDRYLEIKEPFDSEIQFQLQKGIVIEGIVLDRDQNKPISDIPLWLLPIPNYNQELTQEEREERREKEKHERVSRKLNTDAQGRFRCAALPNHQYFLTFDEVFSVDKPTEEEAALYTRTCTEKNDLIQLEFQIPTPWVGTLLQKDGSPAAFYPVDISMRFWNGTNYKDLVTDKEGRFMVYRPIHPEMLSVDTFETNQWFYRSFNGEKLPPDPVFQLYSPLTATGRLVRKSTGEPMKNFKFLCNPAREATVTCNENGQFEIKGIYLNRETSLCFVNPPDANTCSLQVSFNTFTPTIPDQQIELGTIALEESGRIESVTLENLPGKVIEIEGMTLEGQIFEWEKYRGKVVLIEFWATWCGPCLREIPHLKEVYAKYRDRGFEIVGISVDEDLKALKTGLAKHDFPWTVLSDQKWKEAGNLRLYDRFSVRGIPRGILLDQDGKVITIETRGEKLETELKKYF